MRRSSAASRRNTNRKKKKVIEKDKELERREQDLEEKHPKPGDVIELNVGGTQTAILRSTLTKIKPSLLATMFSGRSDEALSKDKEGRFFINQPIEHFQPLLNHLMALESAPKFGPPIPPKIPEELEDGFYRMIESYGLTLGVYPISIYRLDGGQPKTLVDEDDLTSTELSTYVLLPTENSKGKALHNRQVFSFEVTLGTHQNAQIGWIGYYQAQSFNDETREDGQGAGYHQNSIALDCGRSGVVKRTSGLSTFHALLQAGLTGNGSVVRCESRGASWFLRRNTNDIARPVLVASTVETGDASVLKVPAHGIKNLVPCISVNGAFKVTKIELEIE